MEARLTPLSHTSNTSVYPMTERYTYFHDDFIIAINESPEKKTAIVLCPVGCLGDNNAPAMSAVIEIYPAERVAKYRFYVLYGNTLTLHYAHDYTDNEYAVKGPDFTITAYESMHSTYNRLKELVKKTIEGDREAEEKLYDIIRLEVFF